MDNMKLYEMARSVPQEAKKTIGAGRLKGMTDVNPMWRLKRLTEMFGACGIGWWYEVVDRRIVDDELTHQRAAFVDIMLYYIDPATGGISHGIPGTGGASFVAQEKNGAYLSDECFKMALTDAISVAAKALGVAADVYFEKDRSKYTSVEDPAKPTQKNPTEQEMEAFNEAYREAVEHPTLCEHCGNPVLPYINEKTQKLVSARAHIDGSKQKFNGNTYCINCIMGGKVNADGQD